jgi:hypothetical protein
MWHFSKKNKPHTSPLNEKLTSYCIVIKAILFKSIVSDRCHFFPFKLVEEKNLKRLHYRTVSFHIFRFVLIGIENHYTCILISFILKNQYTRTSRGQKPHNSQTFRIIQKSLCSYGYQSRVLRAISQ